MKNKISRKIGIPLTKSGRQRMVGRGLGCVLPLVIILIGVLGIIAYAWHG